MAKTDIFLRAATKEAFDHNKDDIDKRSIVFIEEAGEEAIHTQDKTYQTVPSNGKEGQFLMYDSTSKKAVWKDFSSLDNLSYGVRWLTSSADPQLTRVGNMNMHRELPIQSAMKGCVYDATTNNVVYWLDKDDWRFREDHPTVKLTLTYNENSQGYISTEKGTHEVDYDKLKDLIPADNKYAVGVHIRSVKNPNLILKCIGFNKGTSESEAPTGGKYVFKAITENAKSETEASPSELDSEQEYEIGSNRTGYDGEVRVRIPELWYKSWDNTDAKEVRISTINVEGDWYHSKEMYVSAYLLTKIADDQLTDTESQTPKPYTVRAKAKNTSNGFTLFSIANELLNGNTGKFRTGDTDSNSADKHQYGRGSTYITRDNARKYMPNDTHILSYLQYKVLAWLYVIEYANFNVQEEFKENKTSEGLRDGGLGPGFTTVDSDKWNTYNNYKPLCLNGITDSIGNNTGVGYQQITDLANNQNITSYQVPRYRGIENPFGHIWRNVDGIIIKVNKDVQMNEVWVTDNPEYYSDTLDKSKYQLAGHEYNANGYVKEFDLQDSAEIIPISNYSNGSGTTQYKCDYHYTATSSNGKSYRTLLLGGRASDGGRAGLFSFDSYFSVSYSYATVGFWSCVEK